MAIDNIYYRMGTLAYLESDGVLGKVGLGFGSKDCGAHKRRYTNR